MEEAATSTSATPDQRAEGKSKDEIALELMRFIATATGYGKGTQAVGFSGKPARTPEEQAEALLGLFERCRQITHAQPGSKA
jgi:hypothetical protein